MEKIKNESKDEMKVELKVPKDDFNPRVVKINPDDERFFAYESQKSHH